MVFGGAGMFWDVSRMVLYGSEWLWDGSGMVLGWFWVVLGWFRDDSGIILGLLAPYTALGCNQQVRAQHTTTAKRWTGSGGSGCFMVLGWFWVVVEYSGMLQGWFYTVLNCSGMVLG